MCVLPFMVNKDVYYESRCSFCSILLSLFGSAEFSALWPRKQGLSVQKGVALSLLRLVQKSSAIQSNCMLPFKPLQSFFLISQ